jgi:hypothetical protein
MCICNRFTGVSMSLLVCVYIGKFSHIHFSYIRFAFMYIHTHMYCTRYQSRSDAHVVCKLSAQLLTYILKYSHTYIHSSHLLSKFHMHTQTCFTGASKSPQQVTHAYTNMLHRCKQISSPVKSARTPPTDANGGS